MSAKRAKPGCKLTLCGEIPQDWECVPLGEIFAERVETGFNDLPLLAVTGDRGVVPRDSLNRRDSSNEDKSAYLRVLPGDIAYNTMRMWQGVAGLSEHEGLVSPAYTVCRPLKKLVPGFAPHLLKNPANIRLFHRHSQGLVDDTLNLKFHHFAKIQIAVPPTNEQRRIAAILDDVNSALNVNRTLVERRRQLRRMVAIKVFERDFSRESKLLHGWRRVLLSEVTAISTGSTPNRGHPEYFTGNTPWVKTTEVQFCEIRETEDHVSETGIRAARLKIYPVGTVLMAMYGQGKTRGQIAMLGVPAAINQACAAIVPNRDVLPWYLFHNLSSRYEIIRSGGQGSNQDNLNLSIVSRLPLVVPPLEEQRRLVEHLDRWSESLVAEEKKILALERVKTELARRLLTGELRVKP